MRSRPRGYIALISVLLISTSLLIAVASLSFAGYLNRFVVLDAQSKEQSLAYAEACISHAIGEIAKNSSYVAPTYPYPITIGGVAGACTIESINPPPPAAIRYIETKAIVGQAVTRIKVEIISSTAAINSWNEIP